MQTRAFRLVDRGDPDRVIRGKLDLPTQSGRVLRDLPHVILIHGFKGFMDWGFFPDMAARVTSCGIAAVRFNVSGSGIGEELESFTDLEAFARNTVSRELEDLETVRTWIRNGGAGAVAPERAVLVGHSRGGGIALIHAAESQDCRAVVTWAAVATFDRFDDATKDLWRRAGFLPIHNARTGQEMKLNASALDDLERNRSRLDLPAACRKVEVPVLLVHGTDDETVPVGESLRLHAALAGSRARLLTVHGASHTFGVRHPMNASTEAWEEVAAATLETIRECVG
jgi:dienelactone hydrolase